MYDHIGLKTTDLDASVRFYKAALAPLGYELCSRDESGAGFGPPGAPALWLYPASKEASRAHVAFRAPNHASVDRFHKGGLQPHLLRGLSDRPGRQQYRSGMPVMN
jgi:catechol 2,3-dioxygenase-like lactoylglutathione lyase family enzyme